MVGRGRPEMESRTLAIRIDEEVYETLKSYASENGIPFSSPNSILRKFLGLPVRVSKNRKLSIEEEEV